MENRLYQYGFFRYPGVGRKKKRKLLEFYQEEEMLKWSDTEWKDKLTAQEWKYFQGKKDTYNIEETKSEWEILKKKGIEFIYHTDENYPEKLKEIPDPPLGLFLKGKLPREKKTVAIVGARTPTAYGKEMAFYFARELAKSGIAVVSGLAFGIDVAAHKGALDANGETFGILGCGVDLVYPKENYFIYEKMAQSGGILSEYEPGAIPDRWRFPERNRIISGLSDGVLVVEAKKKSGSLITADCALEQGKDVFAIPGRILDPLSEGTNWLIREGAKMVTEPSHILDELFPLCEKKVKDMRKSEKLLDNKEKIVYDCLSLDPKNIEEIINITNFTVSEVISILFRLELNGYVSQIVKDYYIRRMI